MPTLLDEKREGDIRISSRGGNVLIEETWHYIVRADDKRQARTEIEATAGLPLVNLTLSAGGLAICKTKVCSRRADNPIIWDVTCTFSSEVEESNNNANQLTTDPTTWVVTRKTIFRRKDDWSYLDTAGNAFVNTLGVPLTNAPPRARYLVGWRFAQFELPSVTDETIADRNETVNSTTFKGKAAKTLLLTVEDSMLGYYYGRYLRLTQYLLTYDKDTWQRKIANMSPVYLKAGKVLPWTDAAGNIIAEGPLDSASAPAGGFDANGVPQFGQPHILTFDQYATNSFSFLRI